MSIHGSITFDGDSPAVMRMVPWMDSARFMFACAQISIIGKHICGISATGMGCYGKT
jgi:hypothetical protein